MEEGYPGKLTVIVKYTLSDNNELIIDYNLNSDQSTVANVTNHTYFNLSGNPRKDILSHKISILADKITPVIQGLIPTGEFQSVKDTPFDFLTSQIIGSRIEEENEQLKFGSGYDHNWIINNYDGSLQTAAKLYDPESGRSMEVLTTEPGIQFYSGNFLDGSTIGRGNIPYDFRTALCLETQHFPDSPNHSNFPSTVIKPGVEYNSTTVFRFSVK